MSEHRGAPPAFRYAVVEDEPLARMVLVRMLASLAPDAELAWEAEDGETAYRYLVEQPVDVLFLDIVFPPDGAFPLLEKARASGWSLPRIVFVTGHPDQAPRAFDWAAADFLTKPVALPRVQATLERLRASRPAADLDAILKAVKGLTHHAGPERFTVTLRDRILVFRWSEVMYLHTEFRQVYAHTARGKVPLDQGMDDLEGLLERHFVRIHRSSLVNLDFLVEVHTPASQAGEAVMQDGARLHVSRARMPHLMERLAKLA